LFEGVRGEHGHHSIHTSPVLPAAEVLLKVECEYKLLGILLKCRFIVFKYKYWQKKKVGLDSVVLL
jgi:hypothetical protein